MAIRRRIAPWLIALTWAAPALAAGPEAPSAEDQARLSRAAREKGRGVALVGDPARGQGTAFLISREHRLLATAAHVADLWRGPGTIWAVFDGTWGAIPVERVWYHPSLRRTLDVGLTVRSPDPADGPVCVPGPDVAVLQLAEGGPPLPAPWEMAGPEALLDLTGKAVGLLGYPGYSEWPGPGRPAPATLRTGIVRVVDTFDFAGGGHPERRQSIEHTAATPEGSSGSPVFLGDGRVVAVHNILRVDGPEARAQAGMSVRIDALWELLAYHGLDRRVAVPAGRWMVLVPAGPPADPRLGDLRRAVALVRESAALATARDFLAAGRRCDEALRLAPGYASAHLQRSRVFTGYCGTYWATLQPEVKRRQAEAAIADAMTGFRLAPEKADGLCLLLQNALYLGHLDADRETFREAIAGADALLRRPDLGTPEKSFLINLRAQGRHFLGDWDGALRDYDESIRLSPREPIWYVNRAQFWDERGQAERASADRRLAAGLR